MLRAPSPRRKAASIPRASESEEAGVFENLNSHPLVHQVICVSSTVIRIQKSNAVLGLQEGDREAKMHLPCGAAYKP